MVGAASTYRRSRYAELAEAYVPFSVHLKDPAISPLFSELRGLPPTLIQVGSAETLLADATRFVTALGVADVDVTLPVWPHMITLGRCGMRSTGRSNVRWRGRGSFLRPAS